MKRKFYALLALIAAAIVALDQWTKHLTIQNIPLGTHRDSILGIFHLTHTKNTGAAWSMLEGQTWLFVVVFAVFLVLLGVVVWKQWLSKKFEWFCLTAIVGGGIGNLIDRLTTGAVTDMICFDFIDFPVFNVADCFITVGCFALLVYILLFDRDTKSPAEQDPQNGNTLTDNNPQSGSTPTENDSQSGNNPTDSNPQGGNNSTENDPQSGNNPAENSSQDENAPTEGNSTDSVV